jgi:DNA repair exonuclease SbcCD ATPase subunit
MSKLLNLWFSRVGHKEARLHGTQIKFSDPEFNDKPVDTIISLRNGGGKSSIIQLLYSVFQPRKQKFARAEGEARKFDDYFRQGELGFIVTEWTIENQQNGLFGKTNKTRIIGQCVLRTSQTSESGSPILKRLFFSFISSEKLSFHHLPLGFNNQPETNIDDFRLWFNEQMINSPASEPFLQDKQKDWLDFLRNRGFIPEQFQLLSKMNEKEGSADDILAITKIEQFIDLVLTPLIDPNNAQKLPSVIEQHKEKLNKVPILKQEKTLVEKLREHFIALQSPANEYLSLLEQKKKNAIARQQIAARVIKTDISTRNDQNKSKNDFNNLKEEQTGNQQQITKVSAGIRWLESEKLRLIYIKETTTYKSAVKVLNTQKRQYELHLAAQYLGKLRLIGDNCLFLQKEIEQANAPVAEIAAHLHSIGLVYYGIVNNKAKTIEADLTKKSEEHKKIQNTIAVSQQELGKTKGRIEALEKESNKLLNWLKKANNQLNQLQKLGYVQADETPGIAIARIDEQIATTEGTMTELKTTLEKTKEGIHQFGLKKQSVTDNMAMLEKEAEKASELLLAYQNELQSLSHHQTLCELLEADEVNLYTPDLENSIKNEQEKLNQELRQVQNQLELDQEDVDALSESSVFPPGRDVCTVLQHLKDNSIGAYSYGEYFIEQGDITPDIMREQMNRDPARYGGIAVISPEHFVRIKQEFQTLNNLRCPVQITLVTCPDTVNQYDEGIATVMPTSNATFDKKAAALEKVQLERNIENNNTRLSDIKEEYTAYGEILSTLRQFLKAHPEGSEVRYQQALTDIQQQIANKREHLEKLEREIGIFKERQKNVSDSLTETEAKAKELNNCRKAVETYINRYEELRQEKELELQQAKEEQANKLKKIEELENAITQYKAQERLLVEAIKKQENDGRSCRDNLSKIEHRSPKDRSLVTQYENHTEEQLNTLYSVKKTSYDKGIEASGKLRGQLEELRKQQTEAQKEYHVKRGSCGEQEVIDILACCKQSVDDSLLNTLNEEVLKAQKVETLAEADKKKAKREFDDFKTKNIPQKPEELASYESLENCSDTRCQWDKQLEEAQQTEKTIKALIATTEAKLNKISQNIALLNTAVKAAKEEFPDESLWGTYNPFDSAKDAEKEWGNIGKLTKKLDQQLSDAKGKVNRLQSAITNILNDDIYREVTPVLRSRLLDMLESFYHNVAENINDLTNRLEALNHSLERAEKGRTELVGFFRNLVESPIRQLKGLSAASKCPPNSGIWKAWSGYPFIEVKINPKALKAEYLQQTLEEYLNHLIKSTAGITENPVLLIRHGVHKVLQNNISIHIFKPSDTPTLERTSIVDVSKFSGGEKLTTAIMIYCGIVRLIGFQYSENQNPSNFLLLDNPLGKCNYIPFVQMQREMAKLTNIQLIYATGIQEKESLGEFPRIVTLQNQHKDQKTGDRYVKELQLPDIEIVEAQFKEPVELETENEST